MPAVDTRVPSLARAYDYLLGGTASFAADRVLAGKFLTAYPAIRDVLSVSRVQVADCVAQAARGGMTQFIDIGSGLPTWPSVHETARGVAHAQVSLASPARVVYVDRDPAVVAHAATLVPAGVRVAEGDLAEPEALLWSLRHVLDLARPACLVLAMVLHALDRGTARAVTSVLCRALAPGSYVIITAGAGDAGRLPDGAEPQPLSAEDVEIFSGGLQVPPPGVRASAVPGGAVLSVMGRVP